MTGTFGQPEPLCVCAACGPPWRLERPEPTGPDSWAAKLSWSSWMALCPRCGNKRCPGAADHRNTCTESNEPGQPGSLYANVKPFDDEEDS